jgi:hypothetical protein
MKIHASRKSRKRDRQSAQAKTIAIFRELVGERAGQLFVGIPKVQGVIRKALRKGFSSQAASDIAFHMTDWNGDAAFITALLLFPDRFSPGEIRDGLVQFLIHAPNHIIAAAKLHGWPVKDVFGVGALEPESQDD